MPSLSAQCFLVNLLFTHSWIPIQFPRGAIPKHTQFTQAPEFTLPPPFSSGDSVICLTQIKPGRFELPNPPEGVLEGNREMPWEQIKIRVISSNTMVHILNPYLLYPPLISIFSLITFHLFLLLSLFLIYIKSSKREPSNIKKVTIGNSLKISMKPNPMSRWGESAEVV